MLEHVHLQRLKVFSSRSAITENITASRHEGPPPQPEAHVSSVCRHYVLSEPQKGRWVGGGRVAALPAALIAYYLNEPMFYIRTCDCITTLLIFSGSAGGQGALSRLTLRVAGTRAGEWHMAINEL